MGSSHAEGSGGQLQAVLEGVPPIENPRSALHGCPLLRACPRCRALLTHTQRGSCPTVSCPACGCSFCFRCLKEGYCGSGAPLCPIRERQRL